MSRSFYSPTAIYYVLNTLLATAAGILCFQDFATFNHPWKALLFLVGALGSLVGVVVPLLLNLGLLGQFLILPGSPGAKEKKDP